MGKSLPTSVLLSEDEVHVWYVRTDALRDSALLAQFASILSAEERERWQRFSFPEGKHSYLVSHGFLRTVLSRYADVPPADWRFTRNAYGKPEILEPPEASLLGRLCFNLSHTTDLAACAIVLDREVGVDAEDVDRRGRDISEELIRHCLSPQELACFRALPPEARKSSFFDYWTLKEAYLKARGFGLSLPIEAITFSWPSGVPHSEPAAVSFAPEIKDDPQTWQLERFSPTERHRIALAVRRPLGLDLRVVLREFPSEGRSA
jgi:4'-phosphopantetheinyl transferase